MQRTPGFFGRVALAKKLGYCMVAPNGQNILVFVSHTLFVPAGLDIVLPKYAMQCRYRVLELQPPVSTLQGP